jgi:hypothetical protein
MPHAAIVKEWRFVIGGCDNSANTLRRTRSSLGCDEGGSASPEDDGKTIAEGANMLGGKVALFANAFQLRGVTVEAALPAAISPFSQATRLPLQ